MNVYVLIREDQNEHGFVDTSIEGVFATHENAVTTMEEEHAEARAEGLRVVTMNDDSCTEAGWQVHWKIEAQEVL